MNLKIITSINGIPCNLVRAEDAQLLLEALQQFMKWADPFDFPPEIIEAGRAAIKQTTQEA